MIVRRITFASLLALAAAVPAAAEPLRNGGKLVLTNGISTIEGASGGGLAAWAVIGGNATKDGVGAQAAATVAELDAYDFHSLSVAVGAFDRVEISYARQTFNTNEIGAALGLGEDYKLDQDVYGVKVKLAGDLVYGPEHLPAFVVGAQYKDNRDGAVAGAVGARDDDGVDLYASATKLLLSRSLLLNGTLRLTEANQGGLLGFGGDKDRGRELHIEASAAYQFSRRFAAGAEFRSKPDNLAIAREDDWFDLFAAYAVTRNVTATAAYVDLGSIATVDGQRGILFQLQAGF